MTESESTVPTPCPACGASGTGRFCSACGAPRSDSVCPDCGAVNAAGVHFCTQCGAPRSGTTARQPEPRSPWIVAGVLSLLALVLVFYLAGALGKPKAVAMPNAGNPEGVQQAGAGVPPDISNLTPKERFARLNDRVMAAAEQGDTTTVIRFWPMAQQAYQMLPPDDRDVDSRYHMATLNLMIGDYASTTAQADSIMAIAPNNLLGWYLRSIVAGAQGDSTVARAAERSFSDNFTAQMKLNRPEYDDHAAMLRAYKQQLDGK